MRTRLLCLALLFAVSCKQACGLDEVEDGLGGSSPTTNAGGSTTTGEPTTTSTGGQTLPADCLPSGPCVCEDSFDQTTVDGCWSFEPSAETPPFPQGGSWFLPALQNSGYWEEGSILAQPRFLFVPVPAGPFLAATCVRPYDSGGGWPVADYSLAGWIARAVDGGPPGPQNWLKLEAGSIDAAMSQGNQPTHGVRVARREGDGEGGGSPDQFSYGDSEITTNDESVVLALCRLDNDMLLPFYATVSNAGLLSGWTSIFGYEEGPSFTASPLAGPLEVGLVAATIASGIVAEFRWAFVSSLPPNVLTSMTDCQAQLANLDTSDCRP